MVPRLPEQKEYLDNQHRVGLLSSAGLGVELDVLIFPFTSGCPIILWTGTKSRVALEGLY